MEPPVISWTLTKTHNSYASACPIVVHAEHISHYSPIKLTYLHIFLFIDRIIIPNSLICRFIVSKQHCKLLVSISCCPRTIFMKFHHPLPRDTDMQERTPVTTRRVVFPCLWNGQTACTVFTSYIPFHKHCKKTRKIFSSSMFVWPDGYCYRK